MLVPENHWFKSYGGSSAIFALRLFFLRFLAISCSATTARGLKVALCVRDNHIRRLSSLESNHSDVF